MTQHTVVLDLAAALATPHRCSACGSTDLSTLTETHRDVLFTCPRCRLAWRFELGDLVPVESGTRTRA
ncbi:hypothetical protein [Nocardioides rubriscoriae]|uniref:hypothetical protein n=1 Tax=Nocardioides rubriscoriae TaxID=642762 RepID=UPI0011DF8321|nr:hypothetical protein [Nocardioides rubriscoriae]